MAIISLQQGTPEWLAWRSQGVTATDAVIIGADLIGAQLYKDESLRDLWAEKKGLKERKDLSKNPNVIRGKNLEDVARLAAETHFGDMIVPICVENDKAAFIKASLDGILSTGQLVEIKCPHQKTWDDLMLNKSKSNAFKRYWIQIQHQLLVAGAKEAFLCLYLEGMPLAIHKIEENKDFQKQLLQKEIAFWKQVLSGVEPEPQVDADTFVPTTESEIQQWDLLTERIKAIESHRLEIERQLKEMETEQKELRDQLAESMGDFKKGEHNGVKIHWKHRSASVQGKKLLDYIKQKDPDFDERPFMGKDSTYLQMDVDEVEPLPTPEVAVVQPTTETQAPEVVAAPQPVMANPKPAEIQSAWF